MRRITKEQNVNMELVQEVEKHPCLYNYKLEEYSKRDAVEAAWEKVSEAYGETVEDCKDKWKNLRTVFVRNLRPRVSKPRRKSPYYLNQAMQFLLPYVKVQTTEVAPQSILPSSGPEDEDHINEKNGMSMDMGMDESGEENEDESIEGGVFVPVSSEYVNATNNFSITPVLSYTQRQELGNFEKAKSGGTSNPQIQRKENPEIDSFIEYFTEKKKKLIVPESHRKLFLLSLMPEVDSMSASQFRLFRRDALDAVDNALGLTYKDSRSQTRNSSSSSS